MGTGSRREDGEGQEEAEGFVSNTKSSIQKANNVSLAAMASGTRKECVRVCVFYERHSTTWPRNGHQAAPFELRPATYACTKICPRQVILT
jgi:hypothetical protein